MGRDSFVLFILLCNAFRHADGACGTDESAEMAAHATLSVEMRLTQVGIEGDGLMAAVLQALLHGASAHSRQRAASSWRCIFLVMGSVLGCLVETKILVFFISNEFRRENVYVHTHFSPNYGRRFQNKKTDTIKQQTGSMRLFLLFVVSQEGNTFQWQHVFIVVTHLVIIVLPHFNEFIAINQANEFT